MKAILPQSQNPYCSLSLAHMSRRQGVHCKDLAVIAVCRPSLELCTEHSDLVSGGCPRMSDAGFLDMKAGALVSVTDCMCPMERVLELRASAVVDCQLLSEALV